MQIDSCYYGNMRLDNCYHGNMPIDSCYYGNHMTRYHHINMRGTFISVVTSVIPYGGRLAEVCTS